MTILYPPPQIKSINLCLMGSEFQNFHTGFYGHYNNGFSLYPSTVKVKRKFQVMDVSRKLSIPNEKQLIQARRDFNSFSCKMDSFRFLFFISPLFYISSSTEKQHLISK